MDVVIKMYLYMCYYNWSNPYEKFDVGVFFFGMSAFASV